MMTIEEIAKSLNKDIFKNFRRRGLTVFLVGAGQEAKKSMRESVRAELSEKRYYNWFDIYYPEELFEELILSQPQMDLLSLENLLAKSVHAVVIILESSGAIAELGAFANHPDLCNRLIVIVDEKYKKKKSFIMLGPVRFLKQKTKSVVIFHNLKNPVIKNLSSHIQQAVRQISEGVKLDTSVANPIAAQHFLLAALFAMESLEKDIFIKMIQAVKKENKADSNIIATSALNILLREKEIALSEGRYHLTQSGLERLKRIIKLEATGRNISQCFDKLRVEILNQTFRGKGAKKAERARQSQISFG
jgi:hypothetical protein